MLYSPAGFAAKNVVLLNVLTGVDNDAKNEKFREFFGNTIRTSLAQLPSSSVGVLAHGAQTQAIAEGLVLGSYEFDELKTKKAAKLERIVMFGDEEEQAFNTGVALANAQNWTRRLAELPANIWFGFFFVFRFSFFVLETLTAPARRRSL